jgi:lipid-A-disaccharide synthase
VPALLRAASRLKSLLSGLKPDLLILIDFPDFNLHLAGYAKKIGIPVLYYISPQVWAWRSGRIAKIKRRVDHMAVILPFERQIYEKHAIPVTYVGHPLMDAMALRAGPVKPLRADRAEVTVCLLPGSRHGEVVRLLPEMLGATARIRRRLPGCRFLLSCAPTIERRLLEGVMNDLPSAGVEIVTEPVERLFERCHLSIVASGTASLEAAIYGIPSIIVYSTSALNYTMARLLLKVSHIGLANLIAQKRVFPELIQHEARAEKIADTACGLLSDPAAYEGMQEALEEVRRRLGSGGASDKVAEIAGSLMKEK